MIRTVTFNPSIDRHISIDKFIEGGTNFIKSSIKIAGGKGINVSKILSFLNTKSFAYFFCNKDFFTLLYNDLDENFITLKPFFIDSPIRENIKIFNNSKNQCTELNEVSVSVDEKCLDLFISYLIKDVEQDDIVVVSGSMPKIMTTNKFASFLKNVNHKKAILIIDTSGKYLVKSLKHKPLLIKPNFNEYKNAFSIDTQTIKSMKNHIQKVVSESSSRILISLGKKGIYYSSSKHVLRLKSEQLIVKNTVGAGDALLAAYIHAYKRGFSELDCVKYAKIVAEEFVRTGIHNKINLSRIEKKFKNLKNELL